MSKVEDTAVEESEMVVFDDGSKLNISKSRALGIVGLKLSGASFVAIAEIEGLANDKAARLIYERTIAATVDESKDIPYLRNLASQRIERLLQAVWTKAIDRKNPDQLAYTRTALALIDRHSKLHGMDAPQRLEVYTPDAQAKEEWVAAVLSKIDPDQQGHEADIIDAEIVDGVIEDDEDS